MVSLDYSWGLIICHEKSANCREKARARVRGSWLLELEMRERGLLHDGSVFELDVLDDLAVAIDLRINKVDDGLHGKSLSFRGLSFIISYEIPAKEKS